MFVSDEVFDLGTLPGMAISVQGRAIQVLVRVAHVRTQGTQFEIGVEFLQVEPADRNVVEHRFDGPSG